MLQVGRIDRPLTVPTKPLQVARVSFEIARRHRFHRELEEVAADHPDVDVHVLPAAGTSARDDSIFAYRDFSRVQAKIDATYDAVAGLPRRASAREELWRSGCSGGWCVAPATIALTALLWVTAPLWLIGAAAVSPLLPGRWRALRLLWLMIAYLTIEAILLVVLLGYWLASGFGRWIRTPYWEGVHYDLVQGTLWVFFREAQRVLNLAIETSGPTPDAHPGRPILVCCRHAGPGDSFILMYALMHDYAREPRVVLKDTLAWDPAIGVILSRIPARFISPNPAAGEDLESQITALATGLDENDAFVIFPEGGNFTPRRRERGIERLRKLGLERMAQRAEQMTNVLAPRPGGIIAALDGAPDADVVLVAHTGLDHMLTVGDVWRELPMDKRIIMRWWTVKRAEIPAGPRGPDRVALRLVGAHRRVDQRPRARRRTPPAAERLRRRRSGLDGRARCSRTVRLRLAGLAARRARRPRPGSSGVVTSCGPSAASDSASSGPAPPGSSVGSWPGSGSLSGSARPSVGDGTGAGGGGGTYDDCQLSSAELLRSLLKTSPPSAARRAEEQELLELAAALGLGLALDLGELGGGDVAAVGGLLDRGGGSGGGGDLGGRGTGRGLLRGDGGPSCSRVRRAHARPPARGRRCPWRWCPPPWQPPSPGRTRTPATRARTRRSPRRGP